VNIGDRFTVGLLLVLFSATIVASGSSYVEDLYCDQGSFRLSLPDTVDALRKIGQLKSERLLGTHQWGDNSESQTRELEFEGLTLVIHLLLEAPGPDYLLESAAISSPRWSIAPNFKVGDLMSDVRRRLGLSQNISPDQRVFEGDTDRISFDVEKDRIQQIRIRCYTG
jgi:hypothetical protein